MLSIRIVTAGAVLAFAVSAAAAQDSETPGTPISLLQLLTHSTAAKAAPKLEAKRVSTKTIRTARRFHHHAMRLAAATEELAKPIEPAPTPEPTPTPEPASWTAQAAIDAAPPSVWPAGNAPTFAGVPDPQPQVAVAAPSMSNDQSVATSNAVADTQPAPAVAPARRDDSNDGRDVWFEEILATLGGALAAGSVAWLLIGAAPRRRYG
jgi:hypothetical protein